MNVNDRFWECAQISALTSGIPAEWIYAQWLHETERFTNWGTTVANNLGGLKKFQDQPEWFDGDAQSPEGDDYQVFDSPEAYALYFGRYLLMYRDDGICEARTTREYAEALRRGGYYGNMPGMDDAESIDNYAAGLDSAMQEAFGG